MGYVGGLAGENGHQVIGSYATGDVTGNKYVGGLVGSNWGYESMPATITESYSTGAVKGRTSEATDLGGLVGKIIYGLSTQLLGHGDFGQGYIRRWYRHDDLNDEKARELCRLGFREHMGY